MQLFARIRNSHFLRNNAILFFGSVAVGVLNYLYYPILGRLMEPVAFGEVQALVSLFLQLTIFLNVLSLITINIVANYSNESERNKVIYELEKLALLISLGLLVLSIVFGQQLKIFLQFDHTLPFAILALALVVSVPFTFRSAYLRGQQRFGMVSIGNIVGSVAKILFSIGLVVLGFSTMGAIAGIVVAQLLALAYTAHRAKQLGLIRPDEGWKKLFVPDLRAVRPEFKYSALVLVGSLFITIQFSIDVIVIKHLFDAQSAGLYAGVATAARIIFFLTASIAQVLLPAVKLQNPQRQNQSLLIKSLLLLGVVSGPVVLVFVLLPELSIKLLMGVKYIGLAHILPSLTLAIFIVSIANLIVSYFMALRQYAIGIFVILGAVVTYLLMFINNSSIQSIVDSLLYGSCSMLVLIGGWIVARKLKRRSNDGAHTTVDFDRHTGS